MRAENIQALNRLSMISHIVGLFSVFIGVAVSFFDLLKNDVTHLQVGLYVFITGYAFVKIAKQISEILVIECHPSSDRY
jgi:hypothetical protein